MGSRQRIGDRVLLSVVTVGVVLVLGVLAWLVVDLLRVSWPRLSWTLLSELPSRAGRAGGISSILVSTVLIIGVCWAVVVPLGLGAAIALAQARGSWAKWIRGSLDVLAGAPSIVMGMVGMLVFGDVLGLGFSLASGGLTLACMVLPLVVRAGETALRAVPSEIHAGATALGLSRSTTLFRLLLPVAAPGLFAALALGTGRALAETAALIFTAGASDRMPEALTDPGRTLSVHVYELAMNVAGGDASAAASAVVLIFLLVLIQLIAHAFLTQVTPRTS